MNDADTESTSFSAGRRFGTGLNVALAVVILFAIVVMANYLAIRRYTRINLNSRDAAQLSPETTGVLRSITNDLRVIALFESGDPLFPYVWNLLREYQNANPRILLEHVDYLRDPATAQTVKEQFNLNHLAERNAVIFSQPPRFKVVYDREMSEFDYSGLMAGVTNEVRRSGFLGESLFTAALLNLTEGTALRVSYLTGHGEPKLDDDADPAAYAKFAALLKGKNIDVVPLTLVGTNEVPADSRALIIAGPRDRLAPAEIEKIDRYLNNGGRLLVLSYSLVPNPGLDTLLSRWGVALGNNLIFDPDNSRGGQDLVATNFVAHPITRPLLETRAVHLMVPRSVEKLAQAGTSADTAKVEEIVSSGASSFAVTDIRNGVPYRSATDRKGPLSIAVAVEKGGVEGVKSGATRIVVVGDSLFLGNEMIESAANRDFASLSINWLLDRAVMMGGIGPRKLNEFRLELTRDEVRSIRTILLVGVPGAVLLLGLIVWFRRRR
jgi:hypothetical protein